jgi:rod shape-determining protein MreC
MRGSAGPPRRAWLIALIPLVASVALLFLDRRASGPVASVMTRLVDPLRTLSSRAGQSVHGLWVDYVALRGVREENLVLQADVRELQAQAARSADLVAENERLRALLELADSRKDLRLRAARVVARANSSYFRVLSLELDVGDAAVEAGMPVMAPGGVVGQIRNLNGTRAEVLLMTDPRSAIDVVLEQSRARGVAVGTGEEKTYAARLEYLQRSFKVVEGERVLTTGDDGRYPRGLVVGEVATLGGDVVGPFQSAVVRPMVDLGALDEVFVVLGPTGLSADGGDYVGPGK